MVINLISLNPSSIAHALGVVAFLLVLASIAGQFVAHLTEDPRAYALAYIFNVDAERNIPSCFSTFLLLFAALLLAIITTLKRKAGSSVFYWAILAFGFLCMAVDEAWAFHEKLIAPVRGLLGDDNLGVFYFAWVIPGIVLVLVLALFFLRFLLRLPVRTRLTFLMAGAIYIGGAIGVELVGGYFAELHGAGNLTYSMIVSFEESLEMAGVIVFIWALLVYVADNYSEVRFSFEGACGEVTTDDRLVDY